MSRQSPWKTIFVDDWKVPVTSNLESALRHLRKMGLIMDPWVDALCINQSDIPEKSVQVQLMSQIYRNTRYVQCWLGEASAHSKVALTVFKNMGVDECHSEILQMRDGVGKYWNGRKDKQNPVSAREYAERIGVRAQYNLRLHGRESGSDARCRHGGYCR